MIHDFIGQHCFLCLLNKVTSYGLISESRFLRWNREVFGFYQLFPRDTLPNSPHSLSFAEKSSTSSKSECVWSLWVGSIRKGFTWVDSVRRRLISAQENQLGKGWPLIPGVNGETIATRIATRYEISWSHKLPLISRGLEKPKPNPKNYSSCVLLDVLLWPHALRNTIKPLVSRKEITLANTHGLNLTGQKEEEGERKERGGNAQTVFPEGLS